jgi:hypothetical protein
MVEASYPEARLIRNARNEGFGRANNIGIRQSRGRYVALVNTDVVVLPGAFDRLIEYLERHPLTAMIGPKVLNGDGSLQVSYRRFPTVGHCLMRTFALDTLLPRWSGGRFGVGVRGAEAPRAACPVDVLSGCFWLLRREQMDQVGLLDEAFFIYGEDMDWSRRFHAAGFEVIYEPAAEIIHYGGGSTANRAVWYYVELYKADMYYWGKHHGWWGKQFYAVNILLHQLLRILPRLIEYLLRPARRAETRFKIERSMACLRWLIGGGAARTRPQ